jgi:hypothetical protein
VAYSGAFPNIAPNTFDSNRHAIASDGSGSDQVGGVAGDYIDVGFNTFRGEQDYAVSTSMCAAFHVRGSYASESNASARPHTPQPGAGACIDRSPARIDQESGGQLRWSSVTPSARWAAHTGGRK